MFGVEFEGNFIRLKKELNDLDLFVIEGSKIISRFFKGYVIVAGYVAILFGRSRTTEDVDVIIDPKYLNIEIMDKFYEEINKLDYWVFNAKDQINALELLSNGIAVRLAKRSFVIPNFEIKVARDPLEFVALKKRIKVNLNDNEFYISPLELNIAYKIYLGSQKDIEDAVFLYCLFQEKLNEGEIAIYLQKLGIKSDIVKGLLRC